jgi:hypothetical protein
MLGLFHAPAHRPISQDLTDSRAPIRRVAAIKCPKIAPGFGSDSVDSIEASPAHPAPEALARPWASQNRRIRRD